MPQDAHRITLLGAGLIGQFYAQALHGQRGRDRIDLVFSRTRESAEGFADTHDVPRWTTDLDEAIQDDDTDVVIIALPNHLHEDAVTKAAEAGKAILCTKPLGRNADEAKRMLQTVEETGVFHGYLEDLIYTPKTLQSLESVRNGALGDILWVRAREAHPGPHSDWFWDLEKAGGGAIVDMGCHCIEIARAFIGKDLKPVEVMCWADTLVHDVEAEDHGIGLIRFDNGAVGQFEASWAFRGGMDLRDEVSGTEGTIWLDHFLRTGSEMYTSGAGGEYVAEKAESESGWLFPVGDEAKELGYVDMFTDMFEAMEAGEEPKEDFYDGYVVNAIVDACYRSAESKQWEDIQLDDWRGRENVESLRTRQGKSAERRDGKTVVKRERMPDGTMKLILKDPDTGEITQQIEEETAV
jgi:predicted dehydrogenase